MKKLKCDNCGANLKIDDNNEYAYCEYCNLKYKLDEKSNVDSERFNYAYKIVNKVSTIIIVAIIGFILLLSFLIFFIFSKEKNYTNNKTTTNYEIKEDNKSFNTYYEPFAGTKNKFFIVTLLDLVNTNNKTNKNHIISIRYKENEINEWNDIKNLKQKLEDRDYEVVFDYDKEGFINKITLEDI